MKTTWHAHSQKLVATRGNVSVSVPVPVGGSYTNARVWMLRFRFAVLQAEAELNNEIVQRCCIEWLD